MSGKPNRSRRRLPYQASRLCHLPAFLLFGALLGTLYPLDAQKTSSTASLQEIQHTKDAEGDYIQAENSILSAIQTGKQQPDHLSVHHSYLRLCKFYLELQKPDYAKSALDSAVLYAPQIARNLEPQNTISAPQQRIGLWGAGLWVLFLMVSMISLFVVYNQSRKIKTLKSKLNSKDQEEPVRSAAAEIVLDPMTENDLTHLKTPENSDWLTNLDAVILAQMEANTLTLDNLSEAMGISRRQFQRRLMATTGLTATAYLHEMRLQRALYLLESGQVQSVKSLAAAIGMRDIKYFSQEFKKRFGKPPSRFEAP